VRTFRLVLRRAAPGDLSEVRGLADDVTKWLRQNKNTDQWAKPWPDWAGHHERIVNDLLKGKTWLVWDGTTAAATITIDTDEPLDQHEQPVWPANKRREPALYVRRVIVNRRYAGRGLGAALFDWAALVAKRDYDAMLLRVDVWTTNVELHAYYERQGFVRYRGRHPRELDDYPSQALFEREVGSPGTDYTQLFTEEERSGLQGERR
jgi:GNAT superfamily N-acetyltransferase